MIAKDIGERFVSLPSIYKKSIIGENLRQNGLIVYRKQTQVGTGSGVLEQESSRENGFRHPVFLQNF